MWHVPAAHIAVGETAEQTVAVQDEAVADGTDILCFMPTSEIFDGRQVTGGVADMLERFKNPVRGRPIRSAISSSSK
ncbi:hypothetical protein Rhe02_08670 [Rhizocola hellebori]|uniref:Uncharacterized protein n=1 Tax=Rhizocola hellebori TaxID=1392758 RepID=A0A8J3VDK3_9ACTN|nr:hypothetical protein [Rhizocola hellebori]GIH02800.1 hypothetical protein Rhe02_08670 [Rhizocola hellebori]